MTSELTHNVAILDVDGKMIEWNGEDYVPQGTGAVEVANKDNKDEQRDSDQYLVRNHLLKTFC